LRKRIERGRKKEGGDQQKLRPPYVVRTEKKEKGMRKSRERPAGSAPPEESGENP